MVSPVGSTVPSAWDAILRGESGIGPITRFDVSAFPVRFGGQVRDFDVAPVHLAPRKRAAWMSSCTTASPRACRPWPTPASTSPRLDRDRCGAVVRRRHRRPVDHRERVRRVPEGDEPAQDLPVLRARDDHQHDRRPPVDPLRPQGPEPRRRHRLHHLHPRHRPRHAHHPVRRCRRDHRRRRRDGDHARAVSASFGQAKALSTRNDAPQEASRPWDRDRDGFVLSDGGGAVLLEELEHARGAARTSTPSSSASA